MDHKFIVSDAPFIAKAGRFSSIDIECDPHIR